MINQAVQSEHGNVVCIEKGDKLRFDINYQIRLVDSSQYDVADYAAMKGFISGLYAGNYDITHVFIDSLTKIVPSDGYNETEDFLKMCIRDSAQRAHSDARHQRDQRGLPDLLL